MRYGLIQNIVTNLGKVQTRSHGRFERIQKRLTTSVPLRLNWGMGKFNVRKQKVPQGHPEVTVSESPSESTLLAEEVGTWKSYVNVDHMAKER